jgi:hypothetical protein
MDSQWRLARLMDGYLVTQMLAVAARLGVADVLADGPRTSAEIADAVGADARGLHRVLRNLAVEEVLVELDDGRFALAPMGERLREGVPGSLRGSIIARGELYYSAAGNLLGGVRGEGTPYELAYGEPFFEHLGHHPELEAVFQGSMAGRSTQEAADVVDAYDFSGIGRLVDVGGGGGILLAAILGAAPNLTGVLFDRPGVIPAVEERMRAEGVADRCELVAGDFFQSVPEGADCYLLSRVIHDWDDDDSVRILSRVRDAMPAGSRLLLVESLLPERVADQPLAVRMDVNMFMLFTEAHERTEAEYRRLLERAGLQLDRVHPTRSPAGLSVLEAGLAQDAANVTAAHEERYGALPT